MIPQPPPFCGKMSCFFMVLLNKRGEMAIAAVQREVSAAAEMVFEAEITGFDSMGRGVARRNGKAVFVGNALPGERVRCRMTRADRRFDEAEAVEILRPSSFRQTPPCPHYEECGGCSMQHIRFEAQVALKQRVVEEQFARIGGLRPQQMLAPVYGAAWHYRERGRLGGGNRRKRPSENRFPCQEKQQNRRHPKL